ncbi:MAG: cupin domain-containing protein [Burkholderiales bacterium]|jgi:quercetin dioxygenase-like cupin family protein|nr:cupin domain-containing protein [Burkholderiales bacterium]MDP2399957.1 cupin domain-containing protein [Burkholderiales bacterium]
MATAKKKAAKASVKTKTEGAVRAGNGQYQFRMAKLKKVDAGTGYSTSHGGVVEGARILVGYIHKPRGTGSRMHSHKNEQLNYVLRGTLVGTVNGKRVSAPAGTLVYIPANAPHNLVASTKDEDVIFLAIKDLSQGIIGMAVDGTMSGPHYEKGFGPAAKPAQKKSARGVAARR